MPSEPANYGPEDVTIYQEAFRPVAERYRQLRRIVWLAGAISVGLIIGASLLNGLSMLLFNRPLFLRHGPWYISAGGLVFLAICGIAQISLPCLRCPACQGLLDAGISRYCPECD